MVKIKLISFADGIATVDCIPDGNEEKMFRMVLDVVNRKILSKSPKTAGQIHASHAAQKMFDAYAESGSLPETATSAWC